MLFDVGALEEAKPSKQLKSLYARKDRNDGEAIRKKALEGVENPILRERILEELDIREFDESVNSASTSEKTEKRKRSEDDDLDDFDFGPSQDQPSSSKQGNMIRYLENKSQVIYHSKPSRVELKPF